MSQVINFQQALDYVSKSHFIRNISQFIGQIADLYENGKADATIEDFFTDLRQVRARYLVLFRKDEGLEEQWEDLKAKYPDMDTEELLDEIDDPNPKSAGGFMMYWLCDWSSYDAQYAVETFEIPVVKYPGLGFIICCPFWGCSADQIVWKVFDEKFNKNKGTDFKISKRGIEDLPKIDFLK